MVGLTARVGGPVSVLDVDALTFLQFCEGILRENDGRREELDKLYATSRLMSAKKVPESRAQRAQEIERLSRLFGG